MGVNDGFLECLLTGIAGFLLSNLCEGLVEPRPFLKKAWQAWLMHFSLWCTAFALLALLTGRPLCAAGFALAFNLILVLVNNAKFKSMREPFLYHDYDYFLDTLRFPRLFLPFLGVKAFCLCAAGVLAAFFALWAEQPPAGRWLLNGQAGACLLFLAFGLSSFILAKNSAPRLELSPVKDLRKLGFPAFLGFYGTEWHKKEIPHVPSPAWRPVNVEKFPHLVAIQSESFFDCRQNWPGIKEEVYAGLDLFTRESFRHGLLLTPAWGANTERSEFSFLTGISPATLGIARFNPYQLLKSGWHLPALPAHLRSIGYRTICIHPYIKAFYGRDRIFPDLGFDIFMDISSFGKSDHCGPYIGDQALAEKIIGLQQSAKEPTFIFAITMENHGPLHMEKAPDEKVLYDIFKIVPPRGCEEMGIYLRHAQNASLMLEKLRGAWLKESRAVSLCFYGDHVPIMPNTWEVLGLPSGLVPYFCWSNIKKPDKCPQLLTGSQLAAAWLQGLAENEKAF